MSIIIHLVNTFSDSLVFEVSSFSHTKLRHITTTIIIIIIIIIIISYSLRLVSLCICIFVIVCICRRNLTIFFFLPRGFPIEYFSFFSLLRMLILRYQLVKVRLLTLSTLRLPAFCDILVYSSKLSTQSVWTASCLQWLAVYIVN
jgi:hypothetical protein